MTNNQFNSIAFQATQSGTWFHSTS